jgi:hypothetical protein
MIIKISGDRRIFNTGPLAPVCKGKGTPSFISCVGRIDYIRIRKYLGKENVLPIGYAGNRAKNYKEYDVFYHEQVTKNVLRFIQITL